jgi:hypothetical protein
MRPKASLGEGIPKKGHRVFARIANKLSMMASKNEKNILAELRGNRHSWGPMGTKKRSQKVYFANI